MTAQPVSRKGNEICIEAPQSAIGFLFGRNGGTLKQLQEEADCKVHVDDKTDCCYGQSKRFRMVRIHSTKETSLELVSRTLQCFCQPQNLQSQKLLKDALATVRAEMKAEAREKTETESRAFEDQVFRQVVVVVGDSFSEAAIQDALSEENWDPDRAMDRLFQEKDGVASRLPKPVMNVQKLLEACRAANALRKTKESKSASCVAPCSDDEASSSASTDVPRDESPSPVPVHVQAIRNVFANSRRH